MKSKMQELARACVPGAERMRIAAADWKVRELMEQNEYHIKTSEQ